MTFSSVRIKTGEKEPIVVLIVDQYGDPLTGLSDIKIKVRRGSDGFYLDWSDNTFKAVPTQLLVALEEISATYSPGEYQLNTVTHVDGLDTSTFPHLVPEEQYFVTAVQDGATTAVNVPQIGEIKVGGFVDDIVEDRYPVIF
jgi:hypothetical protein